MKINYILLFLLAVLSVSCSKNSVVLTEDELPEDIFYLKDDIKPFNGTCYIYFNKSNQLKEELSFKNGVLHGLRVSYFKNGQIKQKGFFKDGRYNGTWKSFNEAGNIIFEAEYSNDTLTGKYVSWYKTNVMKEKGNCEKNRRVGKWIYYDEAGMIIKQENYQI